MREILLDIKDQMECQRGFVDDLRQTLYLMEQGFFSLDGNQKNIETASLRIVQQHLLYLREKMLSSERIILDILADIEET
ncbi:hypothetical protein [Enterocloster citroniae]